MCKNSSSGRTQWMNPVAVGRAGYEPTTIEHWANILSHGAFVAPAMWLAWLLVVAAGVADGWHSMRTVACGIYGLALVLLFTVSTVFHVASFMLSGSVLRQVLHRADRAMIYVFIAASYTPWLLLQPLPPGMVHLRWGVWVLAVVGIVYQQLFHEMYKMVDTTIYVTIGVVPALAVLQMADAGMWELGLGGAVYLVGVVFFKLDGRLPCAHAVWHVLVGVASYVHYVAVATHLLATPAAVPHLAAPHCARDAVCEQ